MAESISNPKALEALNSKIDTTNAAINATIDGVPTTVSNSNGTAYKFPSGLMICTKTVSATVTCTGTWGNVYESTSKMSFGNWAVSFTATPIVSATVVAGAMGGWIERVESTSKTSAGDAYILRGTTQTNTINVHIVGIGKWK